MSRYIDADAIDYKHYKQHKHGKFNKDLLGDAKTLEDAFYQGVIYIHNCIEDTQTADVVEVVRCKDCIHCYHVIDEECELDFFECRLKCCDTEVQLDDYCSFGERREDE